MDTTRMALTMTMALAKGRTPRWARAAGLAAVTGALLLLGVVAVPPGAQAAPAPVGLGTAGSVRSLGWARCSFSPGACCSRSGAADVATGRRRPN